MSPVCSLYSMCSLLLWEMSTRVREPVFPWLVLMRSHPDQLNKFRTVFFFFFRRWLMGRVSLAAIAMSESLGHTVPCYCTIQSDNRHREHNFMCNMLLWRNKTKPILVVWLLNIRLVHDFYLFRDAWWTLEQVSECKVKWCEGMWGQVWPDCRVRPLLGSLRGPSPAALNADSLTM